MEQHSEILPRLAAFHDGQLNAQERQVIQTHLEGCPECLTRLHEWRALDQALARLPVPEASTLLHTRILTDLTRSKPSLQPALVPGRRWRLYSFAAAAVVLFSAVSIVLWQREKADMLAKAERSRHPSAPSEVANAPELSVQLPDSTLLGRYAGSELERRANVEQPPASVLPKASAEAMYPGTRISTAPEPVGTGDSGIPQTSDWPARLLTAEWAALRAIRTADHLRFPNYIAPFELVEINLLPLFEAAFVPVGYMPLTDGLDPGHEAAYSDPVLLTPEAAYLVSNLRLEQTSLMARSQGEGPTADVALKLAEITWRLANITADRDDVNSAIAAWNLAARHRPDHPESAESRLIQLRALSGQ